MANVKETNLSVLQNDILYELTAQLEIDVSDPLRTVVKMRKTTCSSLKHKGRK